MRIYFKFTPSDDLLPYDYQFLLLQYVHEVTGILQSDKVQNFFSFSSLKNLVTVDGGLSTKHGARFFISFNNNEIGKTIVSRVQQTRFDSLPVLKEIIIEEDPSLDGINLFFSESPIMIRKKADKGSLYLTDCNQEASELLTLSANRKLREYGITDSVKIFFPKNHEKIKTKLIDINGTKHKAFSSPVIIEGKSNCKQILLNTGVGHLNGCGFGALSAGGYNVSC